MRWGIRFQLLLPMALLLPGLLGVCTWTAFDSAKLRRRIAEQLDGVERTLSEAPFPLTEHVLEMTSGLSGAEYLVIGADGRRFATFAGTPDHLPKPGAAIDAFGDRIQIDGRPFFCRGVLVKKSLNAGSTLYIFYPESLLNDAIREAVRPSLVLGASAGLAALILTLVAGQRLVRRTRQLERRTRQIAAGDFSPMPLPKPDDELRDLAKSVNDMAEQLARYQEAVTRSERVRLLGQVSGGLAHQLRNAVTGAKLAVQLHAQSCNGGDAEALEVAERQLSRMATDLQRFFDLGRSGGKRAACSLRDVIDEAVSLLRPQCRHANIELIWNSPKDDVVVTGDVGQLGHAILNVVSNAVEAVGTNGVVTVRLTAEKTAVLEMIDTGPGPDAGIAGRIFDAFVTGKSEGIGLGLAVTKQVIESHGGTVAWQRDRGKTVFRIEIPRNE